MDRAVHPDEPARTPPGTADPAGGYQPPRRADDGPDTLDDIRRGSVEPDGGPGAPPGPEAESGASRPPDADEAPSEPAVVGSVQRDEEETGVMPARRIHVGGRRPRDMVISILVLVIPIFILVGVYRFLGGESPNRVDTAPAIADARAANLFPVAEPKNLPEGWTPISAVFRRDDGGGATLRIGYNTPEDGALQLVESSVPAETLLPRQLGGSAQPEGSVTLGGAPWQRYSAKGGGQALVLLEPERTVIVVGRGSEAELNTLAESVSGR